MEGRQLKAKIDPQKIYFLRFILEASGHMAWLSTLEPGVVLLRTSAETEPLVKKIVEELGEKIGFQGWL